MEANETIVYNLRGECSSLPTELIDRVNPTTRQGVNVIHFKGGGWMFVLDIQDIEFADETEEGELYE